MGLKFFGQSGYQHDIKVFDDSGEKRSPEPKKPKKIDHKYPTDEDRVDHIKKITTVQHAMSKAYSLISQYVKDDSRVENLQESLNILSLGQELCTSKIEEMEQATEEEFMAIKTRLEAQFDRIASFEDSKIFKKFALA